MMAIRGMDSVIGHPDLQCAVGCSSGSTSTLPPSPELSSLEEGKDPDLEIFHEVLDGRSLGREEAIALLYSAGWRASALRRLSAFMRDIGRGRIVTYSRKVFIPLTNLCRDRCAYCTFRKDPGDERGRIMSPDEVLSVAAAGRKMRCSEALFTLGERPEQRYVEARSELRNLGYATTLEYLRYASELVVKKTGLLPHANPGTMTKKEMASLRSVNASMGLMLENISERLCGENGPHRDAPSKHPKLRLATIRNAGELKVAFTTGLLIGIGETPEEIIDSLLAIKKLNDEYGHIQEVIIQNFRAKPGTGMASSPEPSHPFLMNVVAVARLILGGEMSIQVPPNLSPNSYPDFLSAGINDWGGISPVTRDYVNPEAPWPQINRLKDSSEAHGFQLKPRLPLYPEFVRQRREFIPERLLERVESMIDNEGYFNLEKAQYL